MIKDPNTDPIPAPVNGITIRQITQLHNCIEKYGFVRELCNLPDPATPTVAAPAPMNLAAESMSLLMAEVWSVRVLIGDTVREAGCRCTRGVDKAPLIGLT